MKLKKNHQSETGNHFSSNSCLMLMLGIEPRALVNSKDFPTTIYRTNRLMMASGFNTF